jgi:hypothetical protein
MNQIPTIPINIYERNGEYLTFLAPRSFLALRIATSTTRYKYASNGGIHIVIATTYPKIQSPRSIISSDVAIDSSESCISPARKPRCGSHTNVEFRAVR